MKTIPHKHGLKDVSSKDMNIPMDFLRGWYPAVNRHLYAEPTAEAFHKRAADIIVSVLGRTIREKGSAVFVPSAGKSPLGIYALLRKHYRHAIDWSRVGIAQMDEYWGVKDTDPKSFAYFLRKELVDPLGIGTYIHFFDDRGMLTRDLSAYQETIEEMGGIGLVLHGIGVNGHIGFNEPGSDWQSETRRVVLAPSTVTANFAKGDTFYTEGVTLGLSTLTRARHVILIISGEKKRDITRKFFTKTPSQEIPASSISQNPVADCVIDSVTVLS